MKRLLTEAIGTFFLVLTIGLTVVLDRPLAALAIGSVLMVMVYMGGHVSGAHYNPAVTLAIFMRGGIEAKAVLPYMIAQLAGALLAAMVVVMVTGTSFAPRPTPESTAAAAFLVEFLFTYALALVVLHVATSEDTEGNSYFGLAIGFTVLAGVIAAGPISGGAFNPAVAAGATIVDAIRGGGSFSSLWVYLLATFLGGAAAALTFRVQERLPMS